jgi:hypothetical protein
LIYETLVTTLDPAGRPHVAPMGIGLEADGIVLRPFRTASTCRHLEAKGEGVAHFTDNVLLFARAALGSDMPSHRPAEVVAGVVLEDAGHWREFLIEERDVSSERARFRARVVASGRRRDLLMYNRAQHAVIEATILATRLHLTGRDPVLREIERLRPLVEKTAGPRERDAFEYVLAHVTAWSAPVGAHL